MSTSPKKIDNSLKLRKFNEDFVILPVVTFIGNFRKFAFNKL